MQNLRRSFEHAGHVDNEKCEGEQSVQARHARAIAVLNHFRRGGAPYSTEYRRHNPVKGRGKKVLPLIPDRRHSEAVNGSRQTYRHFGMGSHAESLGDHNQLAEVALAEEIVFGVLNPAAGDDSHADQGQQVANDDDPIQGRECHKNRCSPMPCVEQSGEAAFGSADITLLILALFGRMAGGVRPKS